MHVTDEGFALNYNNPVVMAITYTSVMEARTRKRGAYVLEDRSAICCIKRNMDGICIPE